MIQLHPVMTKATKRSSSRPTEYNADIMPGNHIRIHGIQNGKNFDRTFAMGDWCEEDSYNLVYLGRIVAITEKTVTIEPQYGNGKNTRMSIHEFCWRNWDFDLDKITRQNQETSLYI